MYIVRSHDLEKHSGNVGAKTKNLRLLQNWGFSVPSFVAIPSDIVKAMWNNNNELFLTNLEMLAVDIVTNFPCVKYAIRSSALIEDSQVASFAGQFQTEVDVGKEAIKDALYRIITHARNYLQGDLQKFSIIIQEYIAADISGVTFTRDPLEGRDMVIEYVQGKGENLVSGKVTPTKLQFNAHAIPSSNLVDFLVQVLAFQKVEELAAFPQDIEWCIKDNQWYFLQTRPITTITKKHYASVRLLEKRLPHAGDFLYEKTEITEISPQPTPFTFSLLEAIYAANGPVDRVYQKHQIKYQKQDFLILVGNELYVDREQELKTLLPAYSYFGVADLTPHWQRWRGLGTSMKNIWHISSVSLKAWRNLLTTLKQKLEEAPDFNLSLEQIYKEFIGDYTLIFEINLATPKAFKNLEVVLKKERVSFSQVLTLPLALFCEEDFTVSFDTSYFQGNALEVWDMTPFQRSTQSQVTATEVTIWWESRKDWQKTYLKSHIQLALIYQQLREMGRWLTVRHVSILRKSLCMLAQKTSGQSLEQMAFFTIPEVIDHQLDQKVADDRYKQYKKYEGIHSARRLTSLTNRNKASLPSQGVSQGKASGVLVSHENIANIPGNKILYTDMLSPDLVQYFDKIQGIISEQGGMLSHLAILAREQSIPIVVNVSKEQLGLAYGDKVTIDGSTGEVAEVQSLKSYS